MILSDRDLRQRLCDRSIVVEPLADLELQLQPASIDLRLGSQFRRAVKPSVEVDEVAEGADFVLGPGEFALGTTLERVRVPPDLVARVEGRSSIGRLAILVHATAGFIDPGFEGEITLELANLGPAPASLRVGARICQIVFHVLTSPVERPYGPARGSKYAGQKGPTPSRLAEDLTKERER
jgi:dCTP deaminase